MKIFHIGVGHGVSGSTRSAWPVRSSGLVPGRCGLFRGTCVLGAGSWLWSAGKVGRNISVGQAGWPRSMERSGDRARSYWILKASDRWSLGSLETTLDGGVEI